MTKIQKCDGCYMQSTVGKADEAKKLCDLLLAPAPGVREKLTGTVAMQRVHCALVELA